MRGASACQSATGVVSSAEPFPRELSKGLEVDLAALIDPDTFGKGIEGAVDRYVTTARATRQLVILTST